MFVKTKKPKTCNQLKGIIRTLENAPIVSFANLTFKGDKFTVVDSNSKGNTREIANYFQETGKFGAVTPWFTHSKPCIISIRGISNFQS